MGYTYRRRRRSGPNWVLILSALLLIGAGIYFAPRFLFAPTSPPEVPAGTADPVAVASPSPAPSPSPDRAAAEARLAEADQHLQDGQWASAVAILTEVIEAVPSHAPAHTNLARALAFSNRLEEALPHAQHAVEIDARFAEGHAVLGLVQDWLGDVDRALISTRRAADLDPALSIAHAYLAEAYTDKYRLAEAEEALGRALDRGGASHPEVLRVQGYLQETKADYAAAVASYREALTLAPDHAHLHLALGHALRALKQHDDALVAFTRAGELNPLDARAEGGLGMVYYAMEEYGPAREHLLRAVDIDPQYATAHGQLGWLHYVQRDYATAEPHFLRAVELEQDPLRVASYSHALGWIYVNMERYDAARAQFNRALELNPREVGATEGLQLIEERTRGASTDAGRAELSLVQHGRFAHV